MWTIYVNEDKAWHFSLVWVFSIHHVYTAIPDVSTTSATVNWKWILNWNRSDVKKKSNFSVHNITWTILNLQLNYHLIQTEAESLETVKKKKTLLWEVTWFKSVQNVSASNQQMETFFFISSETVLKKYHKVTLKVHRERSRFNPHSRCWRNKITLMSSMEMSTLVLTAVASTLCV